MNVAGGSFNQFAMPNWPQAAVANMTANASAQLNAASAASGGLMLLGSATTAQSANTNDGWSVPITARRKYTLQFNELDKKRNGWLSGHEARSVMIPSGLTVLSFIEELPFSVAV